MFIWLFFPEYLFVFVNQKAYYYYYYNYRWYKSDGERVGWWVVCTSVGSWTMQWSLYNNNILYGRRRRRVGLSVSSLSRESCFRGPWRHRDGK